MKRTVCAVGLAAFYLTWVAQALADVRVTYVVDGKALKAAVTGTNLTFTLFSDSGCTMTVGSPITVAIDNVALIERLKRFVPAGGAKPPATDRLVHVLPGVTVGGDLFLTVSGTGIMPVGGACQFQLATSGASVPCASQVGTDVFFTGCNVNVRSGSGSTNAPVNGLGNLIVGYNANDGSRARPGSHNIVVGDQHSYQTYGGLVAGLANTISAPYASVTGGEGNVASGMAASVSGGECNVAGNGPAPSQGCPPANSGPVAASVSGGGGNVASGTAASVSGGSVNTASGTAAAVSGGIANSATGGRSSVSGGMSNVASGDSSVSAASVSGGACNVAGSGPPSSACNTLPFFAASVSGGSGNVASGQATSISGGQGNGASGTNSSVSGGVSITHTGTNEWHAGQSAGFPTGTEY